MLKRDGTVVIVGAPATPHPSPNVMGLSFGRNNMAGSLIGGLTETDEMLPLSGALSITPDIERSPKQGINAAHERTLKRHVTYRFVFEMASIK